ncbi:MAG: hypothetical protein IVW55_17630 [Chloroflexi bacterium]|nr:hypothetical protein [Chloroflexota bacterium]
MDVSAQIMALQAKVLGRLLEQEQLAWKAFFDFWLDRNAAWLAAQEPASLSARRQHIWELGRFLLFPSFSAERLQAPTRCGTTCMLTRRCSLIAASSQTSSATTRSSASRSSSNSSRTPAGSLLPGRTGPG